MNNLIENKKVLVAYFSHSGNSKEIAIQIKNNLNADIFEIKSTDIYPSHYNTLIKLAMKELKEDYTPILQNNINNLGNYDIVFVSFPNWRSTFPMPVKSFLQNGDFSGKIIIPVCTHEGSYMGRSTSDIKKYCPNSKVLEGLPIVGSSVFSSENKVIDYLKNVKF